MTTSISRKQPARFYQFKLIIELEKNPGKQKKVKGRPKHVASALR